MCVGGLNIFISYKYTDVPFEENEALLKPIRDTLTGFDYHNFVYCNLWDEDRYKRDGFDTKMIMEECFEEIKVSDDIIVVVDKPEISQGMLLEMGYALANNVPVTILCRASVEPYLNTMKAMAMQVIIYDDIEEIHSLLGYFSLSAQYERRMTKLEKEIEERKKRREEKRKQKEEEKNGSGKDNKI